MLVDRSAVATATHSPGAVPRELSVTINDPELVAKALAASVIWVVISADPVAVEAIEDDSSLGTLRSAEAELTPTELALNTT